MCIALRNVTFRLGNYEFNPDADIKEEAEMQDRCKERSGYFHRWVDDVETNKDIPYVKTMALVEDAEDGKIHTVEYYNLQFIDK